MKWIITGGAGFIGCHAANRFHKAGHEVIIMDDLSRSGADRNLAWLNEQGVTNHLKVDIADAKALDEAIAKHADVDAVVHLAGQVAVTSSVKDPRHDFNANCLGTFNVLESVRKVTDKRKDGGPAFLFSSTNKVYGGLEHVNVVERNNRYGFETLAEGVSEHEPLDFHSPYGCSKGAADQYVRDYARIYGMKTVTLRQSCIYGTRQFGVEDQGWIAWFSIAAVMGRPITIYGDGKQVRDALWVEDLTALYELAVKNIDTVKGEVFNVGGGATNTLSLIETLRTLEELLGKKLDISHGEMRPGDQKVFIADTRKAQKALGWSTKTSPREGITRIYEWVQEHKRYFA